MSDAVLFGIDLWLKPDIQDGIAKALVEHEFPHMDGAQIEDMGERARTVRATAVFYGSDFDRHQDLIDAITSQDSGEFEHPKYGIMVGYVREISVRHDDTTDKAEVDFTFVEDLIGSTETSVVEVVSVEVVAETSFLSGLADSLKQLSQDIGDDMRAISNAVSLKAYTSQLSTCLNAISSIESSVSLPATSLLNTITWAEDVPGSLMSGIANTIGRYSALLDGIKSSPTRFVSSFQDGLDQISSSLDESKTTVGGSLAEAAKDAAIATVKKYIAVSGGLQLGLDMAYIYKTDEASRKQQKKSEKTRSFDANFAFLNPPQPDPIMSIDDIEKTLADTRGVIQSGIDAVRGIQALTDMAAGLLLHVDKIKLEREKIVTVTVENTIPLHLLLLQHGLPYNAADRVLAINPQITDPGFVTGDVRIYKEAA